MSYFLGNHSRCGLRFKSFLVESNGQKKKVFRESFFFSGRLREYRNETELSLTIDFDLIMTVGNYLSFVWLVKPLFICI